MTSKIILILALFLLFPTIAYAQADSDLRDKVMEAALYALETKTQQPRQISLENEETDFAQETEWQAQRLVFTDAISDVHLTLGLEFGYLKGNTAYDFDHHTSELEFPMDNWMAGGNFKLGYKNLLFNVEFWTPLEDYAGFEMKDKDWNTAGDLTSYTKSKAYMDAIIGDANLRYDFYKKVALQQEESSTLWAKHPTSENLKFDEIKIGILLGYRYERFDYDLYDLWNQLTGTTTYQGTKVLTYNIKYYLPYLGLATDLLRENRGLGINIKYSFYPTAEDVDNHLLRGLTFYGDYDKHREAWMGSIYGFWKFIKNWKWKVGVDGTFIRIDGRTWEASHDPAWDKDQSTDTRHWIFWSDIEYKF